MKDLTAFYQELKTASALTAEFASAAKNGTLAEFLKAHEVDATAEEFAALANGELDDQQLEAVAGGMNLGEAFISVFTLAVGCIVRAAASAKGSGRGKDPNGKILCDDAY